MLGRAIDRRHGGRAIFFASEDPTGSAGSSDEGVTGSADTVPTTWRRSVSTSRGGAITLGVLFGATNLALVAACVVGLRTDGSVPVPLWIALAIMLPVTLVALAALRFDVRIDERGVTARAALGWPRVRVPLEKITSADVIAEVSPLADFGGWGWRTVGAGDGVVLRTGEAIRIGRDRRSDLTITVDDAAGAVAVLNALRREAGHAVDRP